MATHQLQNAKLVSEATVKSLLFREQYLIINEQFALVTGATKVYNVATILAAEAGVYDLTTVQIEAAVLDTDAASPTNGYFIAADAVLGYGFKVTGEIVIYNHHPASVTVRARVRVSKKKVT